MAEYIKKQDAIDLIMPQPVDAHYPSWYADLIDKTSVVDVVPVVHGRWLWHEEEFEYECSACYCRFDYNPTFENFEHGFHYANWCPYCGAKMDRGEEVG